MSWHGIGNKPINSTSAPASNPSTGTLVAELDSTQLGTANFVTGQSRIFLVTYVLGGSTAIQWQVGSCASTALNGGVDEFYPYTATFQSAQYQVQQTLEKDHRLRCRVFSTTTSVAQAYISAVPLE